MSFRVYLVAVAAGMAVLGVAAACSTWGEDGPRPPARRIAINQEMTDLWPLSRSWVWDVELLKEAKQVRLCIRTTERQVPEGTSPAFAASTDWPATGAEKHTGWSEVRKPFFVGRVTCQVIDFREAGLGDAVGELPLRLLARFRIGSSMVGIHGQDTVLTGEKLAAATEAEPRWQGDELHLLTVYPQTGQTLFAHHVLLQRRRSE